VKTVVKIVAALLGVVFVAAGIGFFFVPDGALRALPGGQGDALVRYKRETRKDLAHWADGVVFSAKGLWLDVSGGAVFDTQPRAVALIPREVLERLQSG
ncbi:MAG: hypothetical protein VW405_15180, partial [Rhodospirillaceae bacterium]